MRVAPDQSILILDSDTNGKWPLIRFKRWWTDNPISQEINLPGWSADDSKHLYGIYVDVQVTPDNRYAVAFSGAKWNSKSDFLLHVPRGFVAREPDTIVTVIDLDRWQIVNSIHTSSLAEAKILGSDWLGLQGRTADGPSKQGIHQDANRLLSLPDLKAGPRCISEEFSHLWQPAQESIVESVQTQNNASCRELLQAAALNPFRPSTYV